jgi:carbamoyl-phosphate synthase large subunit
MRIVYSVEEIRTYMKECTEVAPGRPILLDRFLEDATEVDVDCVSDGKDAVIGAVMEHIEQAGIHSGDSACVIPSRSLSKKVLQEIRTATLSLARELGVRGLMNIQFAVQKDTIYVLEVNPRASRTVPFVSKTIGVPLAKMAAKVMAGKTLKELGFTAEEWPKYWAVKESVFPFNKMRGVDAILGPEMRSTGEVMGIDSSFGLAFAKSQMATGGTLPTSGSVLVSVNDSDKPYVGAIGRALVTRPRLLVLDEPTEGIQPSIIKDIGRAIDYLRQKGDMAIVLVEQYFEFARDLADDFIVMDRGAVVISGDKASMVEKDVRSRLSV